MGVRDFFKSQYFKDKYLKDLELVRMSNGDYCLVRPLGLVPGGKGMRYQENLLRLTPSGIASKMWLMSKQGLQALTAAHARTQAGTQEPSALQVRISQPPSRAAARD